MPSLTYIFLSTLVISYLFGYFLLTGEYWILLIIVGYLVYSIPRSEPKVDDTLSTGTSELGE